MAKVIRRKLPKRPGLKFQYLVLPGKHSKFDHRRHLPQDIVPVDYKGSPHFEYDFEDVFFLYDYVTVFFIALDERTGRPVKGGIHPFVCKFRKEEQPARFTSNTVRAIDAKNPKGDIEIFVRDYSSLASFNFLAKQGDSEKYVSPGILDVWLSQDEENSALLTFSSSDFSDVLAANGDLELFIVRTFKGKDEVLPVVRRITVTGVEEKPVLTIDQEACVGLESFSTGDLPQGVNLSCTLPQDRLNQAVVAFSFGGVDLSQYTLIAHRDDGVPLMRGSGYPMGSLLLPLKSKWFAQTPHLRLTVVASRKGSDFVTSFIVDIHLMYPQRQIHIVSPVDTHTGALECVITPDNCTLAVDTGEFAAFENAEIRWYHIPAADEVTFDAVQFMVENPNFSRDYIKEQGWSGTVRYTPFSWDPSVDYGPSSLRGRSYRPLNDDDFPSATGLREGRDGDALPCPDSVRVICAVVSAKKLLAFDTLLVHFSPTANIIAPAIETNPPIEVLQSRGTIDGRHLTFRGMEVTAGHCIYDAISKRFVGDMPSLTISWKPVEDLSFGIVAWPGDEISARGRGVLVFTFPESGTYPLDLNSCLDIFSKDLDGVTIFDGSRFSFHVASLYKGKLISHKWENSVITHTTRLILNESVFEGPIPDSPWDGFDDAFAEKAVEEIQVIDLRGDVDA